jgi:hypothetical protein
LGRGVLNLDIGKEKPAITIEPVEVPVTVPAQEPRPVEEPVKTS